jgi:hypothetical protein
MVQNVYTCLNSVDGNQLCNLGHIAHHMVFYISLAVMV